MSKKKRRPDLQLKGFGSQPLLVNVSKAEAMMRRGRWHEAQEVLESLDQQYPDRVEVVKALVNLYHEIGNLPHYQLACSRLSHLKPDDPEITLMLAGSYAANFRPILALRTFQQFLDRWPNHDRTDEVREIMAQLEDTKNQIIAEVGLSETESLNVAILHETAQSCLEQGRYEEGRKALVNLLDIRPDSIPDLNNLSLVYFFESNFEEAIATSHRVLELNPNNIHALSNLTRYSCLSGQLENAKSFAQPLKTVPSDTPDCCLKKVEGLSFLADDQGILDSFQEAEKSGILDSAKINPLLYHLAGVAAMRLGEEKLARQYWQQALKLDSRFELAQENLEDSQQLISQRQGSWAFNLNSWITPQAFRDLTLLYEHDQSDEELAAKDAAQRYLQKHPEIVTLIPLLLDRGDEQGREFALGLALMADTPEMQVALRDFAISQRGSDKMRQQAAQIASQAELFPPGPVRMWLQGEWREIMLLGFEVHDEQSTPHSPQVQKIARDAVAAIKQGNIEKGQRLLKQALKIEPDATDLQYNLAGTYERQGRSEEALEIIRQLHEQNPDYVFGRIGLAQFHMSKDELEEAEALLKPLISRQRFHYSEFDAFCHVQIELYVAQKNPDAARSWLEMWATINPNALALEYWRKKLGKEKEQKQRSAKRVWTQME